MASTNGRDLFGGAMGCEIPKDWRDVSDLRPVPSNQEVFQEMDGQLLVLEILERQSVSDAEAASFFFDDLAGANGALEKSFTSFQSLMGSTAGSGAISTRCTGIGFQKVLKPGGPDWIRIEVAVFRIEQVSTDLLLTVSTPLPSAPTATSVSPSMFSSAFRSAIESLKMRDWSLFA